METVHDRDLTSSDVGNHLRNEERIELRTIGFVYAIIFHLVLEGLNSTNTNTKDNTNAVLVFSLQIHLTILNCLLGSNHGQLGIAVHLTRLFAVEIVVDVEVLNLTSKFCLE